MLSKILGATASDWRSKYAINKLWLLSRLNLHYIIKDKVQWIIYLILVVLMIASIIIAIIAITVNWWGPITCPSTLIIMIVVLRGSAATCTILLW